MYIFFGGITFLYAFLSVFWSVGWPGGLLVGWLVIISKKAGSYTSTLISEHLFDDRISIASFVHNDILVRVCEIMHTWNLFI